MNTSISILVDNHACEGFQPEHGFSLWIEAGERRILFDTGQGGALVRNAEVMGIDLEVADMLVLSHGHYDHSGGVADGLSRAGKAALYCHPGAVTPRYSVGSGTTRPLQMPHAAMAAIDRLPWEKMRWVQSPLVVGGGIGLTGPIPRETAFEDTGGPFFLDPDGRRPDAMDDEIALWIQTESGLIVCVGCAHAGLVNTLRHVRRLNDGARIRAVIGGFHLLKASPLRISRTMEGLSAFAPDYILPCHCTGDAAVAELGRAFGNRCRPGAAGMVVTF